MPEEQSRFECKRKNMETYNIENLNESDFPIHVTGLDLLINKEERKEFAESDRKRCFNV